MGKDLNVATDFLPHKDRKQQEEQLRKQLAKVHTAAWEDSHLCLCAASVQRGESTACVEKVDMPIIQMWGLWQQSAKLEGKAYVVQPEALQQQGVQQAALAHRQWSTACALCVMFTMTALHRDW